MGTVAIFIAAVLRVLSACYHQIVAKTAAKPRVRVLPPAVASEHFTLEEAQAAALHVYRHPDTGRYIMSKERLTPREVRAAGASRSPRGKPILVTKESLARAAARSKR